jgi:hypothetical protein
LPSRCIHPSVRPSVHPARPCRCETQTLTLPTYLAATLFPPLSPSFATKACPSLVTL